MGVVAECFKVSGSASVYCPCDFSFYQYLFLLSQTSRFFLPYFLHYSRFSFWCVFLILKEHTMILIISR